MSAAAAHPDPGRHFGAGRVPTMLGLTGFGGLGLFAVAAIDSSLIPLPLPGSTDLLLLLLIVHGADPWTMALAASAGSLLGAFLCWSAGKKGGQAALQRYAAPKTMARVSRWVQANGMAAVAVAALLPPPFPLTPFVLAAGALGVRRRHFLISFGIARSARYWLFAWIADRYGRRVLRLWSRYLSPGSGAIVRTLFALMAAGILFGFWRYYRQRRRSSAASASSLAARK